MSQKRKSPPAATEGQAKLAKFACNYVATSARPAQSESCDRCQFFRRVALPSGRNRLLCMLTGERLTAADVATACAHFMPGDWAATWGDPDDPRQSLVCGLCRHAVAPTRRSSWLGATVCRLHRPEARSAAPVHCPAFRTRRAEGVRHAA